jgi:hypothetical protein
MKKKFDFVQAIEVILLRHGATQEGQYGWQLTTRAGLLDIGTNPTWVSCRFADPEAAAMIIDSNELGSSGSAAGHLDWYYTKPTQKDADFLEAKFVALLDSEVEAAVHPLERASRTICANFRARGLPVTLGNGEDSDEYLVIFPPNRRKASEVEP